MKIFDAYKAFTRKGFRIISTVIMVLFSIIIGLVIIGLLKDGEENSRMMSVMFVMIEAALLSVVFAYGDYFSFFAVSNKPVKSLNYMRTSIKGEELLKKAIIGDLIVQLSLSFVFTEVFYILCFIIAEIPLNAAGIINAFGAWVVLNLFVLLFKFILRRFCRTMISYFVVAYFGQSIVGLPLGGLYFLIEYVSKWYIIAGTIAGLVILLILGSVLFIRRSTYGYICGFADDKGKKTKETKETKEPQS